MLKRVCDRAINMPTIFSLLMVLALLNVSTVSAMSDVARLHNDCREKHGDFACSGHPVRPDIKIYSQPNESSRTIDSATIGSTILLLDVEESVEAQGWIPVYAWEANNEEVIGWVRHDDIVVSTDLSRVVGCWPVKIISWFEEGAGDYDGGDFSLEFSVEGDLQPEQVARNYAVYYSRGVFLVMHLSDPDDEYMTVPDFFLDKKTKSVFVSLPAENPSFEMFSDEALAGCEQIPQTDSTQTIKFK